MDHLAGELLVAAATCDREGDINSTPLHVAHADVDEAAFRAVVPRNEVACQIG